MPDPTSAWAKQGLSYERRVVKSLVDAGIKVLHNPAFEFEDDRGPNYCVPDILIPSYKGDSILIECKLTYKIEAILKLRNLYAPVVQHAFSQPVICLVIAKNITPNAPEPKLTLESAICETRLSNLAGVGFLIQWLGKGTFPIR